MTRRKKNDTKVAVAYTRASTDEQHHGPRAQKDAIRRWADREGVQIVAWHSDMGISGSAPLEKRPGLLDALESLSSASAGTLVIAKRDRLARDVMIAGFLELQARRRGARIVSAAGEGTQDDDPTSVLMRTIVDAFAAYERGVIRARTRAALAAKKRRGEVVGKAPFGYRVGSDGVHLVQDPEEQAVLVRVVELRAQGQSIRGIVGVLDAEGITSRVGKAITKCSIENILKRAG